MLECGFGTIPLKMWCGLALLDHGLFAAKMIALMMSGAAALPPKGAALRLLSRSRDLA